MLRQRVSVREGDALGARSRGDVLGELGSYGGVGDDPGAGEQLLDLSADVRRVPPRSARCEPGQDLGGGGVTVERADRGSTYRDAAGLVAVAEVVEFGDPAAGQLGPIAGHHLVRAAVSPGPRVPDVPQPGVRFLARVLGTPCRLVALDVAGDLRRTGAEPPDEWRQLRDLTVAIEAEAVPGERRTELRIGRHRRMPDSVHRVQRVTHPDRVQAAPRPDREHPRVDLQMQMPVRIARPGGAVPHRHRLHHLHRDLDLSASWTDPGRRVLSEPVDDLFRGAVLRRVVGGADVRVQLRRERPRLRPVHGHLDEPDRIRIASQPASRYTRARIDAGHPRLVPVAGQRRQPRHPGVQRGDPPLGYPGLLAQVVVVSPDPIGFDIVAGSSRRRSKHLHPAVHFQRQSITANNGAFAPRSGHAI